MSLLTKITSKMKNQIKLKNIYGYHIDIHIYHTAEPTYRINKHAHGCVAVIEHINYKRYTRQIAGPNKTAIGRMIEDLEKIAGLEVGTAKITVTPRASGE
jgi:hypothetical protein